jgi:hypothetical protein
MAGGGREALATARLASLYALSLLTVAATEVAWGRGAPIGLALLAATLGLALVLGTFLAHALSAVATGRLRRRARLLALVLVPVPSAFALAMAFSAPRLAAALASALVLLQIGLLFLCEAFGLELLVLWGSLVLALVAVPGGQIHGAVSLTGFLALAGVYFALDHVQRRLALWPHAPAPPVGRVVKDALRAVAVPVILLGAALAVLPAPAPEAARDALAVAAPEVGGAYRWLILIVLAGTGALALALRGLRPRTSEASPLVEMPESHVEAEEPLEAPADGQGRWAPARERIIRAYTKVLARGRDAGLRLESSLTPREIALRLRGPEVAVGTLTGLFMDARYGPDEPDAAAVHRAEAASHEIASTLRVRRRTARRARGSSRARGHSGRGRY